MFTKKETKLSRQQKSILAAVENAVVTPSATMRRHLSEGFTKACP